MYKALISLFVCGFAAAHVPQYLEANDAGETVMRPFSLFKTLDHKFFHYKRSFEEVSAYLTEEMEAEFDVFILANVSYERYGFKDSYIPSQRMRILAKTHSNQKVFMRNSKGEITDVYDQVLGARAGNPVIKGVPTLLKISSGAGHKRPDPQPYVDTFSGIFRVNVNKSIKKKTQTGMFNSLYVDLVYPWGKASGIAIHGTPNSNIKRLGRQASHGCIRIKKSYSSKVYRHVLSKKLYDRNLPKFNRRSRLPSLLKDEFGQLQTRPGQRVLIVLFYGYDGQAGLYR